MNERQLQFRVGLLALFSLGLGGWLVVQFGELRELWEPTYRLEAVFDKAPGIYPGTPVRTNGIKIGSVSDVRLDQEGVIVALDIETKYPIYRDAVISLSRGLLGDSSINVLPGRSQQAVSPDVKLIAQPYVDPMEVMQRVEENATETLDSFQQTSHEWRSVGANLNGLLETNRGDLDRVVEQTAESLHQFSVAMQAFSESAEQANAILGDPRNQENLRKTLEAVPGMVEDSRAAIAAVRLAVQTADENLANIAEATGPLADRSASIATNLDATLVNLERLSSELAEFAQLVNEKNGTLRAMASDPSLYRNLDRSAESLTVLLSNLEPVMRDLRIFSDKVARHPELMGLGGAIAPSDGTKGVTPASHERSSGPGTARLR